MSLEQNKALTRALIENVWNGKRTEMLDQYLDVNVIHHNLPGITNRASFSGYITSLLKAFPDFKVELEFQLADGDFVVHYQKVTGTQTGAFNGMPASGSKVDVNGVFVFCICEGKITEIWGMNDNLMMMQQLGVVPVRQPA